MFLRFTKGDYKESLKYRKAVLLGDSLVVEYGDDIIGIAKLHEETEKYLDYDVVVASKCKFGPIVTARYIKDMIGKSNKFSTNPSTKRRRYYVEEVDCKSLPIKAEITFKRI